MKKTRYENPHSECSHRAPFNFLLWKLGYYDDKVPFKEIPCDFVYPGTVKSFDRNAPSAMWIGHSTYLIEIDGLTILTDPVWDTYCSPFPIQALRRLVDPPLALADLPPIDIVLISHNHYDHLDVKTVHSLKHFHPQIEWIVPSSLSPWFKKRGIDAVRELKWWDGCDAKGARITAVPAQHFSGRTLFDKNKTHWNGYVLEFGGKKLYFAGDTGYNRRDFKAIGERFGQLDLSMIPIGTYAPEKFMKPVHISPFEAVQIHQDVHSLFSLGMHWKTFRLSEEPLDRPPFDLYLSMKEKNLSFDTFLPIDIGVYVNF